MADALDNRAEAKYARNDRAFLRTRNYGDFFETLMLYELPHADYLRGGAYVLGSSNVVFCAEFGDLPPAERKLIHNYGFPGADPTEMSQFVQYLINNEGLFRAGGDKSAVLICLSHTDMIEGSAQFNGAGGFFPSYLKGSELFDYDAQRGVRELPMGDWQRSLKLRRNQWRSFIHRLERLAESVPRRQADAKSLRAAAEKASAAGETTEGSKQWIELASFIDDLKARHVRVGVLIMPIGSWYKGLPAYDQFMTKLPQLTAQRQVPLIDCSGLLKDEEFMDHHHATASGAMKVHEILLKWAHEQLHETGALP